MNLRSIYCSIGCLFTVSQIVYGSTVTLTETQLSSDTQPVTLADGKVIVSSDENGAISYLRMNPDENETLTLTGSPIRFADGAQIIPGQSGKSCLSNEFSAEGSLTIGIPVQSYYTGQMLPSNSYAVLFRNLRLDDISPISTDFSKNTAKGISGKGYPYFIRRSGDSMTVQFQMRDNSHVKGVLLELKQTGNDISGKVLGAGYLNGKAKYIGYDMFYSPTVEVTPYNVNALECKPANGYGYGIAELTIGPRRDTYDYREKFLSDEEDVVVAKNVAVQDLEFLYGADGANKSSVKGMSREVMKPYHVKYENGELSAQFQLLNDNTVKGVKVLLRQRGSDVVARIDYASYCKNAELGCDLGVVGTSYNVMTEEEYTPSTYGYSLDLLALRRKSRNRLEIPVEGLLDLTSVLSGSGVELTFSSVPSTDEPSEQGTVRVDPVLCGTEFKTLASGVSLSQIKLTAGKLGGTWGGKTKGPVMLAQGWLNDGMTASCQMQALVDNTLKAMNVELRQNGDDVEIRCTGTIYIDNIGADFYGKKILKSTDAGATVGVSIATAVDGKGYALVYVEYEKCIGTYVRAASVNSMTDTAVIVKGEDSQPMTFSVCHASALPEGSIDVFSNAALNIPVTTTFAGGLGKGRTRMTMHPGSRLYQSGSYVFYANSQQITLDGADLYPQYGTTSPVYCNYLTLSGGATVHEGVLNCAHSAENPAWRVVGDMACTNNASLVFYAKTKGVSGEIAEFVFDVADTDADVDLVMNGGLSIDATFCNATFLKKGNGTMLLNGLLACTNLPVRIVEGVLKLSGGETIDVSFSLEGGTLNVAEGASHSIQSLIVSETSSVLCEKNALLAMDELQIAEEAILELSSPHADSGIAVSKVLDKNLLSRITLNGRRVFQAKNGRLIEDSGFTVIIR